MKGASSDDRRWPAWSSCAYRSASRASGSSVRKVGTNGSVVIAVNSYRAGPAARVRRSRCQLSAGLTGLLHSAHDRTPVRSAAVRPPAPEVLEAEAVICDVARRLRAPEPVAAQGVAMVRALLTDGNALLYQSGAPGALH